MESEKLKVMIRPSNDLVFKLIFFFFFLKKKTNKNILISLLNEILSEYNEPIEDVELISVEVISEQLRLIVEDLKNNESVNKLNKIKNEMESNIKDKSKEKNNNEKASEKIKNRKEYIDGLIKNLTEDRGKRRI